MSNRYFSKPCLLRKSLIFIATLFLLLFVLLPVGVIFVFAFQHGYRVYLNSIFNDSTISALKLTLFTTVSATFLNALFGIAIAWLISNFKFQGKGLLLTILDLPLAISPVIVGMLFLNLFGKSGIFGGLVESLGVHIIFSWPGILLCTTFVTVPFVARELIPFMVERGSSQEEAAITLGASGKQTFLYITLPAIKWALFYGIILCQARAMGEFGAVSVVSGHIRGLTNTLPLHIEVLYNEYNTTAAFAVSSILACFAIMTLLAKKTIQTLASNKTTDYL